MRVAVLSSTNFGLRCLSEGICGLSDVRTVGILTTPRRIPISYSPNPIEIRSHASFSELAAKIGCELVELAGPVKAHHYLQHFDVWQPDLILALGWYYNVPKRARDFGPLGCLGIHASLLPKYRGGAPIPWAIINGEKETGVTLFHLVDDIDAGDIVAQGRFPIEEHDTCATVYEKAEMASVRILRECLPKIAAGRAQRIRQDHRQATVFPQRKPEDGLIDWSLTEKRIRDFIRAQTHPYPGAFFYAGDKKIVVWDADVTDKAA